jgi:hypothetical protein
LEIALGMADHKQELDTISRSYGSTSNCGIIRKIF